MSYKLNNPQRWQSKYQATAEEQKNLSLLLERSRYWHARTNRRLQRLRSRLGYDHADLQSSEEWLDAFEQALLKDDQWSERRSILKLNALRRRRSGLILLVIYLLAQHGRQQFQSAGEPVVQIDGAPFEELRGNHHNLDHQLLRSVCTFCGVAEDGRTFDGLWAWIMRHFMGWWFRPVKGIHRHTVVCWIRVADMAAGIAPRDPKTLDKKYVQSARPAWKLLHERSLSHLPLSWLPNWHATIFLFLAVVVSGVYPVVSLARWLLRHFHF